MSSDKLDSSVSRAPRTSRHWGVACVAAIHAVVFGVAAGTLPSQEATMFVATTGALSGMHAALFLGAVLPLFTLFRIAFRATACLSLAALLVLGGAVLHSAAYIAELYGSLGQGIAAAALAAFAVLILFTLPVACWGLSVFGLGPIFAGRSARIASTLLVVIGSIVIARDGAARGILNTARDGRAVPSADELEAALRERLPTTADATPQHLRDPGDVECEGLDADEEGDIVFVYHAGSVTGTGKEDIVDCFRVQSAAQLANRLAAAKIAGAMRFEWVVGRSELQLEALPSIVQGFALRPGIDGICDKTRCLSAWQLVARDAYIAHQPVSSIPDLKMGVSADWIRAWLDGKAKPDGKPQELSGLTRIETKSFVRTSDGRVTVLARQRERDAEATGARWLSALIGAQRYVLDAQLPDGQFRYRVHTFSGVTPPAGESLARQAGTTLALCQLGDETPRVTQVAERALEWFTVREISFGEQSLLAPRGAKGSTGLGNLALPLVAMGECRARVGERFDITMGRLARSLMAAQGKDGRFKPGFRLQDGNAQDGRDRLYAAGQAVYALSVMERWSAQVSVSHWPSSQQLHDAVERAMDYYSGPYWDHFLGKFFYLEENWHCLAAAASLEHHRHDRYERFCLDYLRHKSRFILDENSHVSSELYGGYGFGNIVVPQSTPSAGQAEALAAGLQVMKKRRMALDDTKHELNAIAEFLFRQQIDRSECLHCAPQLNFEGAFTESMISPWVRIDYVQHAWAGLGHAARELGVELET